MKGQRIVTLANQTSLASFLLLFEVMNGGILFKLHGNLFLFWHSFISLLFGPFGNLAGILVFGHNDAI